MSIIKFALLNILPAIDAIQKEVDALRPEDWLPHFNKYDYEGEWTVLSLRSPGGKPNAFAEALNNEGFADTELMQQCPSVHELAGRIQCEIKSIRLLNLKPGAVIKEHTDRELHFEKGEARLHFPVFTNPQVEFFLDNTRLTMQEGECWYINANLPHRLANKSSKDRIHLIIDCKVNDWLQHVFQNDVIRKSELSDDEITLRDKDNILNTIYELRRQTANPAAIQLADKLEKKLQCAGYRIDSSAATDAIILFIRSIGIPVHEERIEADTFLPGILIRNGELVMDKNKMLYPGDLLHEAGHLAVLTPAERNAVNGNLESNDLNDGGEMMAIAWSYAACVHLNIDPHIVFHENGYKGGGSNIVENFRAGHFFGTPMLQWCGMTTEPKSKNDKNNVFPQMIKWMRD